MRRLRGFLAPCRHETLEFASNSSALPCLRYPASRLLASIVQEDQSSMTLCLQFKADVLLLLQVMLPSPFLLPWKDNFCQRRSKWKSQVQSNKFDLTEKHNIGNTTVAVPLSHMSSWTGRVYSNAPCKSKIPCNTKQTFPTCVISIVQHRSVRAHDCRSARHCTGSVSSSAESVTSALHFLMTLQGNHSSGTCCRRYLSPVVSNPKHIGAVVSRHAPLGSWWPSFAGPGAGLIPQAAVWHHDHVEKFMYIIQLSKNMCQNHRLSWLWQSSWLKMRVPKRPQSWLGCHICHPSVCEASSQWPQWTESQDQTWKVYLWSKLSKQRASLKSGMLCKIFKSCSKTWAAPMRVKKSGFSMPQQLPFHS